MNNNLENIDRGFAHSRRIQSEFAAYMGEDDPTAAYPDEPADPYELIIFLVEKYGHARVSGACLGIKAADWHRRIGDELRRLFNTALATDGGANPHFDAAIAKAEGR